MHKYSNQMSVGAYQPIYKQIQRLFSNIFHNLEWTQPVNYD